MTNTTLTNFNVPLRTRKRFDEVCHASGRTRTSVLVELMEGFILQQGPVLAERTKRLQEVDHSIRENRRIMGFKEFLAYQSAKEEGAVQGRYNPDSDLPDPMFSDGQDDW
jgi:predicted DNA-binding protein